MLLQLSLSHYTRIPTMTLLKKAMTRRRNEKSNKSPKSNPQLRSRSQERALEQQDDLFERLEKRYLSHSCSSTDSSTDEESPMTAPLTERKRFFPCGNNHSTISGCVPKRQALLVGTKSWDLLGSWRLVFRKWPKGGIGTILAASSWVRLVAFGKWQ